MPELFRNRPLPMKFVLGVVVPAAYGALCGWLLGVNKTAYIVSQVVAAIGGYLGGREHDKGLEGAIRGFVGGALFGGAILAIHEATNKTPKVKLPHPASGLLIITIVAGLILGFMGARRRGALEEMEAEERPHFDLRRIHRSELIGFLGSAILLGSLFLNWWSTSCATHAMAQISKAHHEAPGFCNPNSNINHRFGSFTAFETYNYLDVLLVAACIAPFVLAWIIARGEELSWRPGEVTMIVGILAFFLILVNGVILGHPGSDIEITFEIGYLVGLVGSALIFLGGFLRQASAIRSRKPPGVL